MRKAVTFLQSAHMINKDKIISQQLIMDITSEVF